MDLQWRGEFDNEELEGVHAAAFGRSRASSVDWRAAAERYSLGWVTGRTGVVGSLIGFLNVLTDGHTHAWLQDVVVHPGHQRTGVGQRMVAEVRSQLAESGLEWLHVDFDAEHEPFYIESCGFKPSAAGLLWLPNEP